jgi:hypothetical protein
MITLDDVKLAILMYVIDEGSLFDVMLVVQLYGEQQYNAGYSHATWDNAPDPGVC